MFKTIPLTTLLIFSMIVMAHGQELITDFEHDTTIYFEGEVIQNIYPHPVHSYTSLKNSTSNTGHFALRRKDSNTYDIFSWTGKIGSVTLAIDLTLLQSSNKTVIFSQTFLDSDDDWEVLVLSDRTLNVFDGNGEVLFSYIEPDESDFRLLSPYLGFDGTNTYLFLYRDRFLLYSYKVWRFRTNVSSSTPPPGLAKSAASGPLPMMTFGPSGDYRISLQPAGGGKTTVQLFDMLGRTLFSQSVDDITKPVSFTIPSNGIPRSPFIANVKDQNGSVAKKHIPVLR